ILLAAPARAGFEEGRAAYASGDYAVAYREWLPLAERGEAAAQFLVGVLYEYGQGVASDVPQAVLWYRRAAERGAAPGQFRRGVLSAHGRGVPGADAAALEGFGRAARRGTPAAQSMVDEMRASGRGAPPPSRPAPREPVAAEPGPPAAEATT